MRKFVFLGVFVGLLTMRIFWSSWLFNDDFYNYLTWIESLLRLGPFGFYSRDFSPWAQANYPPLTTGLFATFHLLARWLFPHEQSYALLATFYKLPGIFLETMLAVYMLWRKKYSVGILMLLNPAIWYNTLWWGQTEGIMTVFVVLALASLFKRRLFLGVLLYVLALQAKQSALIFMPLFGFLVLKLFPIKKLSAAGVVGVIIFWSFYLPFVGARIVTPFFLYITSIAGQLHQHQTSVNAYNFWYLLGYNQMPDQDLLWIGRALVILCIIGMLVFSAKKRLSLTLILFAAGMINFSGFLFLTRMHERHLFPTLVLLLPWVVRSRWGKWAYGCLSFIHFVNLYQVWKKPELFSFLLQINAQALSLLTVTIFVFIVLATIKPIHS